MNKVGLEFEGVFGREGSVSILESVVFTTQAVVGFGKNECGLGHLLEPLM